MGALEALEDPLLVGRGNPRSLVGNGDGGAFLSPPKRIDG
jgi:hypothetical protein